MPKMSSLVKDNFLKEQVIQGLLHNISISKIAKSNNVSQSVIYRIVEKYKLNNVWIDELNRCKLPLKHQLSGKEAEIITLFYKGITIGEIALVVGATENILRETISEWKLHRDDNVRTDDKNVSLRKKIISEFSKGQKRKKVAENLGLSLIELVNYMKKFDIDDQPKRYVTPKSLHPLNTFYGQEEKLRDLMEQGYLQSDIAKIFKVTEQTVSKTLKKFGLRRKHHYFTYRTKQDISFENMLMNNESTSNISRNIGLSKQAVSNNIKRKQLREAFNVKSTPVINSKDEIIELAQRGLNYEQIGKIFHRHPASLSKLMAKEGFHIKNNIRTKNRKIKCNSVEILKGRENKIKELFDKGLTRKKVAEQLNVSSATLYKKLKLMDVPSALHSSLVGKEQIITEYFNKGITYAEIGKLLDCHAQTVSAFIKKLGLKRDSKDIEKATRVNKNKNIVIKLYNEGLSLKSIANTIGCSEVYLGKYIKKIGLSRPFSYVKQPFILDGERNEIQQMLSEGYSAPKISQFLGCSVNSVRKAITLWGLK